MNEKITNEKNLIDISKQQPGSDSTGTEKNDTDEKKRISPDQVKKYLQIIIPSFVVVVCAVIVWTMLLPYMKDTPNSIQGKYICNAQDYEATIDLQKNNRYKITYSDHTLDTSGKWKADNNIIALTPDNSSETSKLYYINNKYLVFNDENFLKGSVPEENVFEATFTAHDGSVFSFTADGKCHMEYDSRTIPLGEYISEDDFIIITDANVVTTYLKCNNGISKVFFTRS